MEYTTLGKTGLQVSIAALGCGGHSRLGQAAGESEAHSVNVVRTALDEGINFIDTAEAYKTEPIVGSAIAESGIDREKIVISTKKGLHNKPSAADIEKSLDQSLKNLRSDYIDVYHLHGVRPDWYDWAYENAVPVLEKLKAAGKIRHIGITEFFIGDPSHKMLARALEDDCWEVVMVGINLLNFSARKKVLKLTSEKQVGTMAMFAVRRALSNPQALTELIAELKDQNKVDADFFADSENPLKFLTGTQAGKSRTIMEAAYRFCRHEAGINTVLTGTGNAEHLKQNVASILADKLPTADSEMIEQLFSAVDCVSGN